MLDRLRGAADPLTVLASVPGIGRRFAERLHNELGIHTIEQLEAAAHDGRLATIVGFGPKRLSGIRDSLAHRLGRIRSSSGATSNGPSAAELLDVDHEYREKAARRELQLIAPRRFDPTGEAWLPAFVGEMVCTSSVITSWTSMLRSSADANEATRSAASKDPARPSKPWQAMLEAALDSLFAPKCALPTCVRGCLRVETSPLRARPARPRAIGLAE